MTKFEMEKIEDTLGKVIYDEGKFNTMLDFYNSVKLLGFENTNLGGKFKENRNFSAYGIDIYSSKNHNIIDKYKTFMDDMDFNNKEYTCLKGVDCELRECVFGNIRNIEKIYCVISIFSNNIIKINIMKFNY